MPDDTVLRWPLHVLDIEASSLEDGGYPIEVGVASWHRRAERISTWSTLIRPTEAWRHCGHWSPESFRVHGISRRALATGMPPHEVARWLNQKLQGGMVLCDGGPYDEYWLRTLFDEAGIEQAFVPVHWQGIVRRLSEACRARVASALEDAPIRHRAAADAEQLLRALAAGIGTPP